MPPASKYDVILYYSQRERNFSNLKSIHVNRSTEYRNIIIIKSARNNVNLLQYPRSRVSSGSIVSDYGLDDRAIRVQSPAGAKDFSSILCVYCVYTLYSGSGVHLASCPMVTRGPFPRGKSWPGRDADHSPPSSAKVVMSRSYTSSPPKRLQGV
jgi:hypothetical protein